MNFLSKIISLTLTSQKESTMQLLSLSPLSSLSPLTSQKESTMQLLIIYIYGTNHELVQ